MKNDEDVKENGRQASGKRNRAEQQDESSRERERARVADAHTHRLSPPLFLRINCL